MDLALSFVSMQAQEFEQYYDEFRDKIYSYLFYRSGRNQELAEDLTSEVFLKAYEKRASYKPDSSFQSWIYAIAHNHLVDFFRKNKTIVDVDSLENVLSSDEDASSGLRQREAVEQTLEMLESLSDDERDILLLRYHHDLSTKEIAEIVEKPDSTVRVTIHRSFEKIRQRYGSLMKIAFFFLGSLSTFFFL